MNKRTKLFITLLAAITVIGGCIYSGRVEYNDDVLSGMSADKYHYAFHPIKQPAVPLSALPRYGLFPDKRKCSDFQAQIKSLMPGLPLLSIYESIRAVF